MGQRNMPSTLQLPHLKLGQEYNYLHPDYCIPMGDIASYQKHYTYPAMSASGNVADPNLHQFPYHDGMNVKYANQFSTSQFYYPPVNFNLGGAAPYNFCYPSILPQSSKNFFVPLNNGIGNQFPPSMPLATGFIMDENVMDNYTRDGQTIAWKRKHPEIDGRNYYTGNIPVNSNLSSAHVSLSAGQLHQDDPNAYAANLMNLTALRSVEYHESGVLPATDGYGTVSSRSHASLHPQPELLERVTYMGQPLQPCNNVWLEKVENYVPGWNYSCPMGYMNGAVETVNMHEQEYQDASSNRDSAFIAQTATPFNHHPHMPAVQSMQAHCYNQHTQLAPFNWHLVNNLQTCNVCTSSNGMDSISRLPRSFPSIAGQVSWSVPEASQEDTLGSSLHPEDVAFLEPQFYGSDSVSDHHEDMQMDIDDMSYEELLALEEQIGYVSTGLSEDSILKNLKTSTCVPQLNLSRLSPPSQLEKDICTVCLVEYEECERIATLDCGHSYHADCIKRWLLMKNQCPVCKKTALATDRRE